MNFIETNEGFIARERVVRVIPNEDGGEYDHVQYVAGDGTVRTVRLEAPMDEALGSTIVPATEGYRVVRVRFADATGPVLLTVTPILAWRVSHATGAVEPITQAVADLDSRSADCAIEGGGPGVVSRGVAYVTLLHFIEARRDALREAQARAAREREARAPSVGPVPFGSVLDRNGPGCAAPNGSVSAPVTIGTGPNGPTSGRGNHLLGESENRRLSP